MGLFVVFRRKIIVIQTLSLLCSGPFGPVFRPGGRPTRGLGPFRACKRRHPEHVVRKERREYLRLRPCLADCPHEQFVVEAFSDARDSPSSSNMAQLANSNGSIPTNIFWGCHKKIRAVRAAIYSKKVFTRASTSLRSSGMPSHSMVRIRFLPGIKSFLL